MVFCEVPALTPSELCTSGTITQNYQRKMYFKAPITFQRFCTSKSTMYDP